MQTRLLDAKSRIALVALAAIMLRASAFPETTVRFAAFGDIGSSSNAAAVAQLVRDRGADLILMLGDLCYGSVPIATQVDANYQAEKAAGKLRPALGNHEFDDSCGGTSASAYRAYFSLPNNERYYDFKRGPVHFFALNSDNEPDGHDATSTQALWLKGKLAASTSSWQVVYFHHPPYSSGDHGSTKYMQWPFEAWGVDAVLAAHDHNYERIVRDVNGNGVKIPYFVVGLGGRSRRSFKSPVTGSEIRYNSAYGALFVTATTTSLKFEFRRTDGTLIDNFTKIRVFEAHTNDASRFRVPPKKKAIPPSDRPRTPCGTPHGGTPRGAR